MGGVRDLRGGGGGGGRGGGWGGGGGQEHEVRVLKGWEVQVLNNLQSKKG